MRAYDLFPTSPANPEPKLVAKASLPVEVLDTTTPARFTAECTNCLPGSEQEQQFHDLQIEVGSYRGSLADLDATVEPGAVVKVWLADTGRIQPQGVMTEFALTATAQ